MSCQEEVRRVESRAKRRTNRAAAGNVSQSEDVGGRRPDSRKGNKGKFSLVRKMKRSENAAGGRICDRAANLVSKREPALVI